MTPRERWIAAIEHKKADRIPMDFWGTNEVVESLKRYFGINSEEEVWEHLHIDKPITLHDNYIGPPPEPGKDFYGCETKWTNHGNGGYWEVVSHPLAKYNSVEEIIDYYVWPSADYWQIDDLHGQLNNAEDRPVEIIMSGVYTDYTNLRGMEQAFIDFAINHDIVEYCLNKMYSLCEKRTERLLEAADGKVDIAWIYNDLGSQRGLLVSLETVKKLFIPGIKRLSSLAHQCKSKVCLHSDGSIEEAIPTLIDAGIDVLNPIQWKCGGMDKKSLVEKYGNTLTFHGAVDNQEILASNDEQAVRAEVRENIDIFGAKNGYILAPCHNAQPVTQPEIIAAMYDEGYRYGKS